MCVYTLRELGAHYTYCSWACLGLHTLFRPACSYYTCTHVKLMSFLRKQVTRHAHNHLHIFCLGGERGGWDRRDLQTVIGLRGIRTDDRVLGRLKCYR